jgi:hypothetical protein
MSGNGKHMDMYAWLTAYVTGNEGMVEFDAPVRRDRGSKLEPVNILLIDDTIIELPSPEKILMKREAYTNLSQEAKEVIEMIFRCPQEIMECFMTPKYHKISKKKVLEYLITAMGWTPKRVSRCFAELKEFSATFD